VDPDFTYAETPVTLRPGDTLVAYTDGITEARCAAGNAYEPRGLERSLRERLGEPVDTIIEGLVGDVERFTAGTAQEDDFAVLGVRYRGIG
jgi:sigma-B regulation protein RsbU (phosphoserine phosphatase)